MSSSKPHDISIPLGIRLHCRNGLHILFPPAQEAFHLKVSSPWNNLVVFDNVIPADTNRPREFKSLQTYCIPWDITITRQDGHTLFTCTTTLSGQEACVRLDSRRLADLVPWTAACATFQYQYNCRLTLLVHDDFAAFFSQYLPGLRFITEADFDERDFFATYTVGHSADVNDSPKPYAPSAPLQNIAAILCLTPPVKVPSLVPPQLPQAAAAAKERTICLAAEGKETAWEKPVAKAVKKLRQQGYTVARTSIDGTPAKCAEAMAASSLVLTDSTDGAWLATALGVPVVRLTGKQDTQQINDTETRVIARTAEGFSAERILQAIMLSPSFRGKHFKDHTLQHSLRFSILVPAFNEEKNLGRCLDSILRQSYPDFELVVLDDGSTDGTAELLRRYAARDSRLRIVTHETNQGRMVSRRDLIQAAKEEYAVWVDADDEIADDYLETAVKVLEGQAPCDIIVFPCHLTSPLGTDKVIGVRPRFENGDSQLSALLSSESLPNCLWGKVLRSELLKKVQPSGQEKLDCEDIFFTLPLYALAKTILYVPTVRPMYHYTMDEGGWSRKIHNLTAEYVQEICQIRHEQCIFADDFLRRHGMEDRLPQYLDNFAEFDNLLGAIACHQEKARFCDIFQQWFCKDPDCLLNDGKLRLPDYARKLSAQLAAIRNA